MGIIICLLNSFLLLDIIKLFILIISKIKGIALKIDNFRFGTLAIVLAFISFIVGYINSHITRITDYNIFTSKPLSKEIKVVALSDLHIGGDMSVRRLQKEVEIINSLKPDIVLLVGDIIDHNIKDFSATYRETFKGFKAKYGVYAANGNHEQFAGSFDEIAEAFKDSGFIFLNDTCNYIEDIGINIVGRDSLRRNKKDENEIKRKSIDEIMKECDSTKITILLDHIPKSIEESKKWADIQISGHTHNGQFFPINIINKFLFPTSYGILQDGDFSLIVSSGLGLWGPPMRIGTRSEVVRILIKDGNA